MVNCVIEDGVSDVSDTSFDEDEWGGEMGTV